MLHFTALYLDDSESCLLCMLITFPSLPVPHAFYSTLNSFLQCRRQAIAKDSRTDLDLLHHRSAQGTVRFVQYIRQSASESSSFLPLPIPVSSKCIALSFQPHLVPSKFLWQFIEYEEQIEDSKGWQYLHLSSLSTFESSLTTDPSLLH